jgi:hypothetical protein
MITDFFRRLRRLVGTTDPVLENKRAQDYLERMEAKILGILTISHTELNINKLRNNPKKYINLAFEKLANSPIEPKDIKRLMIEISPYPDLREQYPALLKEVQKSQTVTAEAEAEAEAALLENSAQPLQEMQETLQQPVADLQNIKGSKATEPVKEKKSFFPRGVGVLPAAMAATATAILAIAATTAFFTQTVNTQKAQINAQNDRICAMVEYTAKQLPGLQKKGGSRSTDPEVRESSMRAYEILRIDLSKANDVYAKGGFSGTTDNPGLQQLTESTISKACQDQGRG